MNEEPGGMTPAMNPAEDASPDARPGAMSALARELAALRAGLEAHETEAAALRSEVIQHRLDVRILEQKLITAEAEAEALIAALRDTTKHASLHNAHLRHQEAALREHLEAMRDLIGGLLGSSFWRVGAPLRRLLAIIRRRPYQPILVPERSSFQLPQLDVTAALLRSREARPFRQRLKSADSDVIAAKGRPEADATRLAPTRRVKLPSGRRVVLTVDSLHRGGVEQVVVDIALALADLGHEVTVVVAKQGGDCSTYLSRAGIEVHVVAEDIESFTDVLETARPEFVFLHHCYFGMEALQATGAIIIETVHNYYVWNQDRRSEYRSWIQPVRSFIAVSGGVAEYHAATFGVPRSEIHVVNNPLNPQDLIRPEPALLRRLRQDHAQRFVFVNIAQFYPAKSHQLLLSAFIAVHARHPTARLRLIGQHMDAEVTTAILDRIEAAGLRTVVELTGFVDRRQLSHLLATSHVFVQPSVYEGYSIAMAEAAHFALPLILTRVGGAYETVQDEDAGILIPPHAESFSEMAISDIPRLGLNPEPHNLPDLIAAMERMLLEYPDWAERGFVAQARVDSHTPRSVAQRCMEIALALEPKRSR